MIILNTNPNADALHPDAIYRVNIDNDGDYLTDIAFSYVFSKPQNGRQSVSVFVAKGTEVALRGSSRDDDQHHQRRGLPRRQPNIVESGSYTFFAGSRSDAFFFDFDRNQKPVPIRGANGTLPSLISAGSLHGPAWIQIRKRTCFPP